MKNLVILPLLLLLGMSLNAQILDIKDPVVLDRLIANGVDKNGDQKIDQAEAVQVIELDLSYTDGEGVISIDDLRYFINLEELN